MEWGYESILWIDMEGGKTYVGNIEGWKILCMQDYKISFKLNFFYKLYKYIVFWVKLYINV
jgi:hypothetical protein